MNYYKKKNTCITWYSGLRLTRITASTAKLFKWLVGRGNAKRCKLRWTTSTVSSSASAVTSFKPCILATDEGVVVRRNPTSWQSLRLPLKSLAPSGSSSSVVAETSPVLISRRWICAVWHVLLTRKSMSTWWARESPAHSPVAGALSTWFIFVSTFSISS